MDYLKLVNCPVRGLFPEKSNKTINWKAAGFNPTDVLRLTAQGFDTVDNVNHVSLFPIANRDNLDASGIVETVNGNANENDSAEIITEAEADALKVTITIVKNAQ